MDAMTFGDPELKQILKEYRAVVRQQSQQFIEEFYKINENFLVSRPGMDEYQTIYKYVMFDSICLVFRDFQEVLLDDLDFQECLDEFYGRVLNGGLIRTFKWMVEWIDQLEFIYEDEANYIPNILNFDEEYNLVHIMTAYPQVEGGVDAI